MAKASNVFVFFNCDGDKNESSMNVFYNNKVYKDTKTSRKVLLKKVMEELEAKRVQISEENLKTVETLITEGNPEEAGKYIQFGAIKTFECF